MKTIDIFCASQASTSTAAAVHTLQPPSSGGGPAIDRHNPIIRDQRRLGQTPPPPPPPPPPAATRHRKNSKEPTKKTRKPPPNDQKRKKAPYADENEITTKNHIKTPAAATSRVLGWGCTRPGDFISPANSSRYLLTDKLALSEFDPLLKLAPAAAPPPPPEKLYKSPPREETLKKKADDYVTVSHSKPPSPVASSSSFSSSRSSDQVVVLRVSLHCRGCERKMRKHISKMEGVTSFDIDFAAKKVTVVGDVTPVAVLMSVSKVKNAKLLTPTTISSSSAPHDLNFSQIKKQLGIAV